MKYICYRPFDGPTITGKIEHIKRGEILNTVLNLIVKNNAGVCLETSYNSHLHFSDNEDSRGLYRGDLTYAIAFSPRQGDDKFRLTEKESDWLKKTYPEYIKITDPIIFGDNFFHASIDVLEEIAKFLNIQVKEENSNV